MGGGGGDRGFLYTQAQTHTDTDTIFISIYTHTHTHILPCVKCTTTLWFKRNHGVCVHAHNYVCGGRGGGGEDLYIGQVRVSVSVCEGVRKREKEQVNRLTNPLMCYDFEAERKKGRERRERVP